VQESKTIIAVVTCHARQYPKHDQGGHKDGESRAKAVRDTWLKDAAGKIEVKFFYGRGAERTPEPDEVFLDVDDSYYGLPEKVRAIFQYCTENGYDEVTKVDDDVFVRVDRLLGSPLTTDYRGFEIESDIKYASGTCYQLSRRAMEIVARSPIPAGEWREDRHVGRVLLDHGIQVTHDPRFLCCSCDVCVARYDKDSLISIHLPHPGQLETYHVDQHGNPG
jgi:hypothetical protein